nr:redox-sensitive transcriptional activator SoxR [Streptomyces sp. SID2563]
MLSIVRGCVPVNDGPAGHRPRRVRRVPQIPQTLHELTVGQLSARSGAAVSALHFYEAKGLISSRRTSGNQRRYSRDALRRVAFVRAAQRVGIPLATIREALAELPEERTPNRDDWARLSHAWRSELDDRIKQLGRLRDHLTDCIGCGCLSLETCVLSNPDDINGEKISGSRLMPERRTERKTERKAGRAPAARAAESAEGCC